MAATQEAPMEPVAIVTALALMEYLFFAFKVGMSRAKFGVEAPAVSGNEEWERFFRVQQNTVEQLIVFLPALWICATFVGANVAAGIGVVFLVGRIVYFRAYTRDPGSRGTGFLIGFLANVALLLVGLVGAVVAWM